MNMHTTPKIPDDADFENQICRMKYVARLVVLARDNACDDIGGNALHIAIDLMEREAEAASEMYYRLMHRAGGAS